jgi:hypothetical protein
MGAWFEEEIFGDKALVSLEFDSVHDAQEFLSTLTEGGQFFFGAKEATIISSQEVRNRYT